MSSNLVTKTLLVDGMICSGCENRIERSLIALDGVRKASASYKSGRVEVTYDQGAVGLPEMVSAVKALGYEASERKAAGLGSAGLTKAIGAAVIILVTYFTLDRLGAFGLFNAFPLAKEGMGYGMLFVIGLFTSVHCIAMCGGINLSQSIGIDAKSAEGDAKGSSMNAFRPPFEYNAGRVISYTVIGGLVGSLGSVVSFTGNARGIVQLVAGVFMVIMGLNMIGVMPSLSKLVPALPKALGIKVGRFQSGRRPLIVGLLNGLMPCGPLQAMQLYALSTGSFGGGALSMFFFSLGTVPLMFGLGAVSSMLSRKFKGGLMVAGAVLVVFLGVVMFGNGLSLSGVSTPALAAEKPVGNVAQIVNGVQLVSSKVLASSYEPIVVQKGVPVRWTLTADRASINGCNNRIIIPSLKKEKRIEAGNNVVEFTPQESGIIPFSCWMGMIKSRITVVDDIKSLSADPEKSISTDNVPKTDGIQAPGVPSCCL